MNKKRIAINGFGRIGRLVCRLLMTRDDLKNELELVAINDLEVLSTSAHLLEFDSNHGRFMHPISADMTTNTLTIGGKKIAYTQIKDATMLPWKDYNIDIVLECTGHYEEYNKAIMHKERGAKKVILSAPAKDEGFTTIVFGVNEYMISKDIDMYSNASCTTNCLAPLAKALDDAFTIESGLMTTIHSYTNDQRILDLGHSDLRRSRAAALSMIPTTTGAAKAVGLVLPHLKGKLNGFSVRVPTPTVSLTDLTATIKTAATVDEINAALQKASALQPHILGYETRPLVSIDYKSDARSSIIDASSTYAIGNLVKVVAWYDNEWGYSNRLVELARAVSRTM